MSYQRSTITAVNIPAALNLMLARASEVTANSRGALLAGGAVVQLKTGDLVWVANVIQDDPATLTIEFFTVALALDSAGAARFRPSGAPVGVQWWHAVDAPCISALGMGAVRKTLMLQALGAALPAGTEEVFRAYKAFTAEQRSIRTAIAAAAELAAPLEDVL